MSRGLMLLATFLIGVVASLLAMRPKARAKEKADTMDSLLTENEGANES
jgi:hypothetical protein